MKQIKLMQGDNILSLKKLPDNSIDSIVTDPPYGLGKEQDMNIVLKDWIEKGYSEIKGKGFMGKEWDAYVPQPAFWKEVFRVLKPGGHVLCFFGTRTYDIGTMAMRLAGFEIRDQIMWIYGSGFPKSLNIGKAFDKKEGNKREVIEISKRGMSSNAMKPDKGWNANSMGPEIEITKGSSKYEGWGTALKPANEPICLARKPLSEKTIVDNVIKWGTGGINVDGCRIGTELVKTSGNNGLGNNGIYCDTYKGCEDSEEREGRFPANILFDEEAAQVLDEQSGISKSNTKPKVTDKEAGNMYHKYEQQDNNYKQKLYVGDYSDKGGASRFFYVAKVGKKERNLGLDNFEDKKLHSINQLDDRARPDGTIRETPIHKNNHPTLKPINLMTYLCRLITPPGGIVLDPFMGSGSTGISACLEGFRFVGMELDEDYFKIAEARINNFEEYRKLLKK